MFYLCESTGNLNSSLQAENISIVADIDVETATKYLRKNKNTEICLKAIERDHSRKRRTWEMRFFICAFIFMTLSLYIAYRNLTNATSKPLKKTSKQQITNGEIPIVYIQNEMGDMIDDLYISGIRFLDKDNPENSKSICVPSWPICNTNMERNAMVCNDGTSIDYALNGSSSGDYNPDFSWTYCMESGRKLCPTNRAMCHSKLCLGGKNRCCTKNPDVDTESCYRIIFEGFSPCNNGSFAMSEPMPCPKSDLYGTDNETITFEMLQRNIVTSIHWSVNMLLIVPEFKFSGSFQRQTFEIELSLKHEDNFFKGPYDQIRRKKYIEDMHRDAYIANMGLMFIYEDEMREILSKNLKMQQLGDELFTLFTQNDLRSDIRMGSHVQGRLTENHFIDLDQNVEIDRQVWSSVQYDVYVPWYAKIWLGYRYDYIDITEDFLSFGIFDAISFLGGCISVIRIVYASLFGLVLTGFVIPCMGKTRYFGYAEFPFNQRMRKQLRSVLFLEHDSDPNHERF